MSGSTSHSKTTTSHEAIRKWVEQHHGKPATVKGTERNGEDAGLLRIDFPGGTSSDKLEHITWEEFFRKFDESDLAFLYQDEPDSTFNKFIAREHGDSHSGAHHEREYAHSGR